MNCRVVQPLSIVVVSLGERYLGEMEMLTDEFGLSGFQGMKKISCVQVFLIGRGSVRYMNGSNVIDTCKTSVKLIVHLVSQS